MILINFKNYKEAMGERAVNLARICQKVGEESGVEIISVVTPFDLYRVRQEVASPVWVQHLDGVGFGAFTGWLLPELAAEMGANGVILNHSEHKLMNDELRQAVMRCKYVGLKICVCADSLEEAEVVSALGPDFIAFEPPELIGNKEKSVSTEKGEEVKKLIERSVNQNILIGAGIHSGEDVRIGMQLGAKGVLVASDVVLAENSEKELGELAAAFKA